MKTIVTPMKRLYAAAALAFMMFVTVSTNAQPAFGEDVDDEAFVDDPGDPEDPEDPCEDCPIDGGIYAGIVAAGVMGYTLTRQKTTV